MATTREDLHAMVDTLPSAQFDAARHALWVLTIPEDEEPLTAEELESIREARAEYARGESVPDAELRW